ncbi:MAG: hypothetical protein MJ120_02430, partial [Clostridia bacterium]|nr:hypothetical protein [Clostridia bacterium]
MADNVGRSWSMDEIDMLLSRTNKKADKKSGTSSESSAVKVRADKKSDSAVKQNSRAQAAAIKELFAEENAKEVKDGGLTDKASRQRVADAVRGIKEAKKNNKPKVPQMRKHGFDEPQINTKKDPEAYDFRTNFSRELKEGNLKAEAVDGKTKVIERPGFVIKRGKADAGEGLEEAPMILDAEKAKNSKELFEEERKKVHKKEDLSWSDEQMKLYGFDGYGEVKPDKITEEEAERNLRKNRREKIDKFKLLGIAEAEEKKDEKDWNIEKLFAYQQTSARKQPKVKRVNNAGFEYTNPKDVNRIRSSIARLKKVSLIRLLIFVGITVLMLILNIVAIFTAGYDTKILQTFDLILLAGCLVIGISCINNGVIAILKKEPDVRSAIALASLAALVQNICAYAGSFILHHHTFVISSCVAAAFALNELGEYIRHLRTSDAFDFCTGKQRKKLFSVHEIENKNEKYEIGRSLHMDSPDIRYSCRAKFPYRLIEQCESNVSVDKLQSMLLPVVILGSAVCGIIGGVVGKNVLTGVTVWAAAMCASVPAFGTLSIQLPMRWVNKRLNSAGGLITNQNAIDDFSKANSIVIDSAELFDLNECKMHGFKPLNNIRVDDIMLYAAAMVIRSGGPLSKVFDQVVSKRELLPEVSSFNYEERMGISGWINGQKVIMGNSDMMRYHNFELGSDIEEEKYAHDGRKVIYLAIANSLAAMLVVSYAPNKKLIPFIRRLGEKGVTILLRNTDSNVTTEMINKTFGAKFNNINIISGTANRIYKKYRNRVRD